MASKSILSPPDFDVEDRVEAERAQVRATSFTRAEMDAAIASAVEAARAEAYAEGYTAGETAMRDSIAQKQAATLETLLPRIDELLAGQQVYCDGLELEMIAFMRDFCEKLFPEMVGEYGREQLATELRQIARRALGSPWLEVKVPEGYGALARELARPEGEGTELRVTEDPDLLACAVSANWQNGRSAYDFDALCGDILSLFRAPNLSFNRQPGNVT
ncbi:hypothetical protein [Psychromarinibacter halotolerans]|uniref:Flagellar assembly protein FliH n=1 Tax=Psychromarinibacter halotolerans TaxID=1775175 RepID=A0ABV7GQE5_9RHOB|nr:hypothetical protein [Psychromarinibacter halotolerans]MDF0595797.1 hypothetical protein [Psychromarinibacter halotolerans]